MILNETQSTEHTGKHCRNEGGDDMPLLKSYQLTSQKKLHKYERGEERIVAID